MAKTRKRGGYLAKASKAKTPEKQTGSASGRRWSVEIERYERATQKWTERAEKITKRYLDEEDRKERRFAILWANIETMKPAVYARRPLAVVGRRFKDADPVARKAADVLERCINTSFDLYGVDDVMQAVRDDRLLAARGTAWVRYEAEFEDIEDAEPDENGVKPQRKVGEKVVNEFVHWRDFGHTVARTWPEVPAVWRRAFLTREEVKKHNFANAEAVKRLSFDVRPEYAERYGAEQDALEPQAVIYEIWDKRSRKTIWLNRDNMEILEEGRPPLDFRDFFPCPKPSYGTKATTSLVPKPDYIYYQDQAEEIDDLTARISNLTGWLQLKGFMPSGPSGEGDDAVKKLLKIENAMSNKSVLVPVESWAGFQEKGGAAKIIEWLPLDKVVTALREALSIRRELKNDVFELTGLSDIIRGETDPGETLGAQQIKAQTGSRRISTAQRDLARFARDLAELNGEVIAEVFSPATMGEMSNFDMTVEAPPELLAQHQALQAQLQAAEAALAQQQPAGMPGQQPPQPGPSPADELKQQLAQVEEEFKAIEFNKAVVELLRDERTRGFRIDIETDSTVEPDEQAEKQRRMEFLTAVSTFMREAMPALQLRPALAPVMKEMLLFLVRGFRVGRSMEDVIERAMDDIEKAAAQASQAPPQPDPKVVKAQADAKLDEQRLHQEGQLEARRQDQEAQLAVRAQDIDADIRAQEGRQEAAMAATAALRPGGQLNQ